MGPSKPQPQQPCARNSRDTKMLKMTVMITHDEALLHPSRSLFSPNSETTHTHIYIVIQDYSPYTPHMALFFQPPILAKLVGSLTFTSAFLTDSSRCSTSPLGTSSAPRAPAPSLGSVLPNLSSDDGVIGGERWAASCFRRALTSFSKETRASSTAAMTPSLSYSNDREKEDRRQNSSSGPTFGLVSDPTTRRDATIT